MNHRTLVFLLPLTLLSTLACSSDDDGPGAAGAGGSSGTGTGGSGAWAGTAGSGGSGATGGSAGGAASGGSAGTVGTPAVAFVGRTEVVAENDVRMSWSGSSIHFRFSGTEAKVTLDDAARYFNVFVDGVEQPVLATSKGEQTYTVAENLSDGEHEVRLFRRTEGSFGTTRFLGVDLGSGTLLAPTPPSDRRIELIGDSITCGYGNEGPNESCNFSAETENHTLTYGAIAAEKLNADLITVAWSGKGVIYNYGDNKDEPLPQVYDRVIAGSANSTWDFSWQPHVVVINLGTNDFSTDGDPSQSLFSGAYKDFLTHLRDKYPQALLLCLVPTGLLSSDKTAAKAGIDQAVSELKAQGDSNIAVHDLSFQSSGWGCDYHPSLATHASMAEALTSELSARLGW